MDIQDSRASLLNIPFSCCTFENIMESIEDAIEKNDCGHTISITNTESAYYAGKKSTHFDYIQKADFSCCDGVGVVAAGRIIGKEIPRLHGPDLMAKCCEYGVAKGWRHFFYGGREGVPELLSQKLTEKFPGMITAGSYSPPFRPLTAEEDREIVELINRAEPDILWVGLGLLKQEKWIAEHRDRLNVPWMVGVGAAFDFHAGTIKRAPVFFQKVGLEWAYRLVFEPRMFVRNMRSAMLLLQVSRDAIKTRLRKG